jgi:hypothetical protein
LGNATTAIAFDEWYDTRNTKNLSIQSDAAQNPKMIVTEISRHFIQV